MAEETLALANSQGFKHSFSTHASRIGDDLSQQPMAIEATYSPANSRKRKAPTLREADWERVKERLIKLHVDDHLPLKEIKEQFEKDGFSATIRQYRGRLSQWELDQNIKPPEMKAIVRKRQRRKLVETSKPDLTFEVRGFPVPTDKIERWMKRNDIADDTLLPRSPSADTPKALTARTVSNPNSPAPSVGEFPGYSAWNASSIDETLVRHSVADHARTIPEAEPFIATAGADAPKALEVLTGLPSSSYTGTPDPTLSPAFLQSSLFLPKHSSFQGQSPVPSNPNRPEQFHFGQGSTQTHAFRHRSPYDIEEEQAWRELKDRETVFGQGHENTLGALKSYGSTLLNSGRNRKAEEIFRTMLGHCRALGKEKDPQFSDAQNGLGQVFIYQGMLNEGQRLLEKASASRRELLGPSNPRSLESLLALARCQRMQGNYRETERLCRDVLIESQDIGLSSGHHIIRSAMFNLGATLRALGAYLESEIVLRELVELAHGTLGLEDPDVIMYTNELACTMNHQGRTKEATQMLRGCFEALTRLHSDEHPTALRSAQDLAVCLSEQENY